MGNAEAQRLIRRMGVRETWLRRPGRIRYPLLQGTPPSPDRQRPLGPRSPNTGGKDRGCYWNVMPIFLNAIDGVFGPRPIFSQEFASVLTCLDGPLTLGFSDGQLGRPGGHAGSLPGGCLELNVSCQSRPRIQ